MHYPNIMYFYMIADLKTLQTALRYYDELMCHILTLIGGMG